MERVTEPELMESPLQVKAYAMADFSKTDRELINGLEAFLEKSQKTINPTSLIVDLGCGPGNIAELLALRWPFAEVLGIDGSKEMLSVAQRRAKELNDKLGINNLNYLHSNIFEYSTKSASRKFEADLVVSNSLLHHIHEPKIFWNAIKNISTKGTVHYHRDLRRPESSSEALDWQQICLPNAPRILIEDYIASLHAAFNVEEIQSQMDFAGLKRFNVFEVGQRYLEVTGIF